MKALDYLTTFIPSILAEMRKGQGHHPAGPAPGTPTDPRGFQSDIKLKVESLHTLTLIGAKYPSVELRKYDREVRLALS